MIIREGKNIGGSTLALYILKDSCRLGTALKASGKTSIDTVVSVSGILWVPSPFLH